MQGAVLMIADLFSTLMACADPQVMGQESAYLDILRRVVSFKVAGNQLEITDRAGRVLVFTQTGYTAP